MGSQSQTRRGTQHPGPRLEEGIQGALTVSLSDVDQAIQTNSGTQVELDEGSEARVQHQKRRPRVQKDQKRIRLPNVETNREGVWFPSEAVPCNPFTPSRTLFSYQRLQTFLEVPCLHT